MAEIDLAKLTSPISEAEQCGPDLDALGDADYMNFVAKAESLLPASFFGPDEKPFGGLQIGGTAIDFPGERTAMQPLLARTHDVRLLTILAKFCILSRDTDGFATAVRAIHELLAQWWDEVHPRAENGQFAARMAALETLDDLAPVIFPLQYAPLVRHPRIGPISYRNYMIATGEVARREGEDNHDLTTIEKALMEVELAELIEALGRVDALGTALTSIRNVCTERAGFEQAMKLERLPALVDKMKLFLNGFVAKRDPAASLLAETSPSGAESAGAGRVTISGEVRSLRDAAAALAAVADYFSRNEPSNPSLLLVRQAEQLMGKSFMEVMQALVPAHLEQAMINIGRDQVLHLPLQRLAEFGSTSQAAANGEGSGDTPSERPIEVKTRADAFKLLEQTAAFYRATEPSSPLPYLIERARDLADRDFLSLLKHVLPEGALTSKPES
jgi:type VI secretion system protein ImpA